METEIKAWVDKIKTLHLPRYDELPELELYLEQVLIYVNNTIFDIFSLNNHQNEEIVTPSMINNYVKNKLMAPPNKKKYRRSHIACIIAITILKQVGSLTDVSNGIMSLTNAIGGSEAYNTFIDFLESALRASASELNNKPDPNYYLRPVTLDLLPLKKATIAFTSVLLSRYLLSKQTQIKKEI
ncbi:MAG: DUF1836 domain-containing protein [Acholeplasmataceae bacterium]